MMKRKVDIPFTYTVSDEGAILHCNAISSDEAATDALLKLSELEDFEEKNIATSASDIVAQAVAKKIDEQVCYETCILKALDKLKNNMNINFGIKNYALTQVPSQYIDTSSGFHVLYQPPEIKLELILRNIMGIEISLNFTASLLTDSNLDAEAHISNKMTNEQKIILRFAYLCYQVYQKVTGKNLDRPIPASLSMQVNYRNYF